MPAAPAARRSLRLGTVGEVYIMVFVLVHTHIQFFFGFLVSSYLHTASQSHTQAPI